MPNNTAKLVHIYRSQGKLELADTVQSFADSLKRYSDNIAKMWAITEHRCSCGKAVVDLAEWEFLEETGMCASCDHARGEYLDDMLKEGENR